MKLASLRPRDRRALALGALLLAPVVLYALAVRPYFNALDDARTRLAAERDLLTRERRVIGEAPDYPARHRRAGSALGATWTRIVRGADTLSIAAALASYVSETAEGAGLLVEQVETRGADSARTAALARVQLNASTVELRARGDLERVLAFLADLETGETIVRVDKLRIEKSSGVAEAADQEILAMSVTVTGIARLLAHPVTTPVRPAALARRADRARFGTSDAGSASEAGRVP
jgi:hypothetical protein